MIGCATHYSATADGARRKTAANIADGNVVLRFVGTHLPRVHGGDVSAASLDWWYHDSHQSLSPYAGTFRLMCFRQDIGDGRIELEVASRVYRERVCGRKELHNGFRILLCVFMCILLRM